MIQENLSEAEVADVDERFTRQLGHMPNFSQEATGADVRRLLVERAGIIREPVAGRIDFTHRTFEEFFAAQAALDMMDIEKLVANAHNDQWREIILLASGLASKPMCEQLIAGLIKRGDEVKASHYRYQLYLLAVSCLDTAIQLGPEIKAEAEKRLSQLVPPKNITDAKAIAGVGELAVKYLAKKWSMPAIVCAACVRALTIIGGDAALDMLEGYANDWRMAVVTELVKAWDAFDRETYARRILSKMFPNPSALAISHLSSVDGLQHFTDPMKLKRLELYNGHRLSDLTPLAGLTNLMMLRVYGGQWLSDLTPLAGLTNLRELDLSFCTRLSDLTPLAGLTNLTKLIFFNCSRLSDLTPLAGLTNLTELKLTSGYLSDLTPLAGLTNLRELDLSYCGQLSDLTPLAGLTNLTMLKLQACSQLSDLTPLAGLTNLTTLDLSRCRQITDWSVLTNLNSLRVLTLSENPNGLPIPLSIKKKVRLSQW